MFRARRRARQWHAFDDLHNINGFVADLGARGLWKPAGFRSRRRRGPSFGLILLAGLAGFALMKLMSAADRPRRSMIEKVVIGVLLLAAVALVLRMRRSARRYTWSA